MQIRKINFRLLVLLCGLIAAHTTVLAQQPPVAKVDNVVTEYHGVKVDDPYRYMEDLEDPYVKKWIDGQAVYAKTILTRLPERTELLQRLEELDAGRPFITYSYKRYPDGSMFYLKRNAGENVYKVYFRNPSGEEKLLVDPETVPAAQGEHYALDSFAPSPDGKYMVYGLAMSGSELAVLHIMDVATGEKLPETIDRIETAYNEPQWLPDGSGFFYSRRRLLPDDAPETEIYKKTKIYFHKLNTPADQDQLIAGYQMSDRMPISDVDFPSMYITGTSPHAVVKVKHGDSNELTLFTAPISTLFDADIPWLKVCDVEDLVIDYAVHENDIFLMTAHHAPRYKVVKTLLTAPDFEQADTVIPAGEAVVNDITVSSDALYADLMDGGYNRIVMVNFDDLSQIVPLELPNKAAGEFVAASHNLRTVFIRTRSWTKGSVVYAYDPADGSFTDTGLYPKGKYDDLDGYESVEVKVKSHDGALVPLSIIYKSDITMDGENPALLTGYGSYGISRKVYFNPLILAWLEKGGVYAVAHVRGGGEYGQEWHYAGRMLNKPNTWKDFIACAEYLVEKGYTSHDLLAGKGGSAGGITIGRSVTERPDLFRAAIMNVGDMDALRMETTTNGVPNIQEFGTVTTEDGFKGLYEMSSYHHVQDGVKYPAVMLTHGMNDPRVDPWNSAKMTARLQAATSSGNPVLFRVEYSAGHGIGSTRTQYLQQMADEFAFLLWQFGLSKQKTQEIMQ